MGRGVGHPPTTTRGTESASQDAAIEVRADLALDEAGAMGARETVARWIIGRLVYALSRGHETGQPRLLIPIAVLRTGNG